jgi:hypothetical protein
VVRNVLGWIEWWKSGNPASAEAFDAVAAEKSATSEEITGFFKGAKKTVLTFVGYSGAGYEDQASMLEQAERVIGEFDPKSTIVNIGATPDGIGAIYEVAKRKGFVTAGIVSAQAKQYKVALSPYVDYVFYAEDATWVDCWKWTMRLSPTPEPIIQNSDIVVGIGGGEIARDELIAARRWGKKVRFIPADMNHQKARESALRKGLAEPTDFHGTAQAAF